jgi:hypothetical protein
MGPAPGDNRGSHVSTGIIVVVAGTMPVQIFGIEAHGHTEPTFPRDHAQSHLFGRLLITGHPIETGKLNTFRPHGGSALGPNFFE